MKIFISFKVSLKKKCLIIEGFIEACKGWKRIHSVVKHYIKMRIYLRVLFGKSTINIYIPKISETVLEFKTNISVRMFWEK